MKNNYPGQDFAPLKKDSARFQEARAAVQSRYAKHAKIKVKH